MWTDILIALAVWRVSLMVVQERGLFGVFERLRNAFEQGATSETGIHIPPLKTNFLKTEVHELLACVWCMSVWVSTLAVLLAGKPVWYILSYSAMAVLCQEFAMRN